MVAWEVAIGRMRSVSDVNSEKFGVSVWAYSLLRKYAMSGLDRRFLNELLLESVRQQKFSNSCSRLEDLYFFESEYDAHAALERWGISGCREFVAKVNFSVNRLTKVDSEWITSYLDSDERDWMAHYWSGAVLGEKPLTEVLASGIGYIDRKDLRRRAYRSIIDRWPTSTPLLAMACCAFAEYGLEDIALVRPAIFKWERSIEGAHFIDLRDLNLHEEKIVKALSSCKFRSEIPPVILPDDDSSFFSLPDLSEMDFSFVNDDCLTEFQSIHQSANKF